jgi:AcrR family transcriptional regulator
VATNEFAARKKCAASTREEIRLAARERFLRENYESVGLREVARAVGVDVALVGRYFGSKEELFKEALRGGDHRPTIEGSAEELPASLAFLCSAQDGEINREHAEALLILLRSASSPAAAKIVQEAIREDVLGPITAALEGDHSEARAGLALAILLGSAMLRAIMGVHPCCDADREFLERKLPDMFRTALSDSA